MLNVKTVGRKSAKKSEVKIFTLRPGCELSCTMLPDLVNPVTGDVTPARGLFGMTADDHKEFVRLRMRDIHNLAWGMVDKENPEIKMVDWKWVAPTKKMKPTKSPRRNGKKSSDYDLVKD